VKHLEKFGIKGVDIPKTSMRIREKYLEYSFGNYPNDSEYLRSIILYYVDREYIDDIVAGLIPNLLNHFELIEHGKEFLEYCVSKYNLVLASNFVTDWAVQLLEKFDIAHYFSKMYVSSELGFRKPSKNFYSAILNDNQNIQRSKILMIGDSAVNDYHGAKDIGMQSILFDNKKPKDFYQQSLALSFEQIEQII